MLLIIIVNNKFLVLCGIFVHYFPFCTINQSISVSYSNNMALEIKPNSPQNKKKQT